ncbi:MAG TPA: hypothetical protein VLJ39_10160 [Tepidisphaeraceae bacterium]|jgi:hypothetical protein|nr:hypothetical protein [Tepidisphaeraceae bacterium]
MVRFGLAVCLVLLIGGCEGSGGHPRSNLDQQMFGPASVKIHPTFTQVRDWTGDGKPDGIEATLEIEDAFGEPTRSTGRAMFELYGYRKIAPDVRGVRITDPWVFLLNTRGQQQDHWNPALRSYTFQLPYAKISPDQYYVLTVQFDLNSTAALTQPTTASTSAPTGGRMFDQLIIEPQNEEKGRGPKYHAPTGSPGH